MSRLSQILPRVARVFAAFGVFVLVALVYSSVAHRIAAADTVKVTASEVCNVKVNFEAVVPTEVQQGSSFMITDIMVQPTQTFGFNVTSSPYTMSSTNTDTTTYEQEFSSTDPSPTSGAQTYKTYYPDWSLKATGSVGSTIVIKPVKTVTNVQGYGTVTCKFTSTLATIKIVAPAPTPLSPPPGDGGGGSTGGDSTGGSKNTGGSKSSQTKTPTKTTKPSSKPKATKDPDTKQEDDPATSEVDDATTVGDDSSGTVVSALAVRVLDSKNKPVPGADVVLDGTIEQTTNKLGGVIFPNVLTGSHSITASFGDRKVSTTIKYTSSNLSKIYDVELPNSSKGLYILLGVIGVVILLAGGSAGVILSIRAKNRRMAGSESTFGDVTLSGVAGGRASPEIPRSSVTQIPVVPMHEQVNPQTIMEQAPWHVDIPTDVSIEPVASPASAPVPVVPAPTPVAAPVTPTPVPSVPEQVVVPTPSVVESTAPQIPPAAQSANTTPDYDVGDS